MKAIGDLASLRRALPDALGVKSAAVAAHDLDLWPPLEPIRGFFYRAGPQHVGDRSARTGSNQKYKRKFQNETSIICQRHRLKSIFVQALVHFLFWYMTR